MNTMNEIVEVIEEKFNFLFNEGFSISGKAFYESEFGNWIVALESPRFKIRFRRDRNDLFMSIGPVWAQSDIRDFKHFFDLEVVLVYLSGDRSYYPVIAKGREIKDALEGLSKLTRLYFKPITNLFEGDEFNEKEKELHKLGKELFNHFIESLRKNVSSTGRS